MKTSIKFLLPAVVLGMTVLAGCSGGGGGGEGGGGGTACGGADGNTCVAGEFCRYEDLSCGALPTSRGVCRQIPIFDCNTPPADASLDIGNEPIVGPVCSCDRLEFKNECWASGASQSVAAAGGCP